MASLAQAGMVVVVVDGSSRTIQHGPHPPNANRHRRNTSAAFPSRLKLLNHRHLGGGNQPVAQQSSRPALTKPPLLPRNPRARKKR